MVDHILCVNLTVNGAFSLLFRTTALPAARAGATFRENITRGTFQGMIAATTPNGCRSVTFRNPGVFKLDWP